jgi:hypothetical protein
MTELTKTWPQITRDRIASGKALPYILDIADGTLPDGEKVDMARVNVCLKLLNKVLPDLRAIEHSADADSTFTFIAHLKDGG